MLFEIMKRGAIVGSLLACGALVACSDDDNETADGGVADAAPRLDGTVNMDATTFPDATGNADATVTPTTGFVRPEGHIAVNFTIDDTANRVYTQADGLAWKGSFGYDPVTRIAVKNGWTGPFAVLWDDGAWNAGGHEPAGAVAGDNKWGIAMFVLPDAAAEIAFEYGAIRGSVEGSDGSWIWNGNGNGTFTVPAAATADIDAVGMTLPAFGTTDVRFTLDTSTLAVGFEAIDVANGVRVKSSAWGWTVPLMVDDGTQGDETAADGVFTFVMSENIGNGKPLGRLTGLLKSGDEGQFVFVFGAEGGLEYKVNAAPSTQGVEVSIRPQGGAWTEVPVSNKPDGDRNTFFVVP